MRASLSARSVLTRNEAGAVSLLARAKASASSSPKAAAQRAMSQAGCDVATEIFSSGSLMTDAGSKSGSRVARRSTALTNGEAERRRAA